MPKKKQSAPSPIGVAGDLKAARDEARARQADQEERRKPVALLEECARYATPGMAIHIYPGESRALEEERAGVASDLSANHEFCDSWVRTRWLPAIEAPPARAIVETFTPSAEDAVTGIAHQAVHVLFLKLANNRRAVASVVSELADLRSDLGRDRYVIQGYFDRLAAFIRRGVAPQPSPAEDAPNSFRRMDDYWEVRFDNKLIHIPDSPGMQWLDALLQAQGGRLTTAPVVSLQDSRDSSDEDAQGDASSGTTYPGDLDRIAIRELHDALSDAECELVKAEEDNDLATQQRLREDIQQLKAELGRVGGLGGKPRRIDDPSETARSRYAMNLTRTMRKIKKAHPSLYQHLRESIVDRTGSNPGYLPRPPVVWMLR